MVKLSIIIPAYNAEPEIYELLNRLNPQITEEVEVVIVDDGSTVPFKTDYKWARVIRQENKGLAGARNTGIANTTGEYIAFIDADDLVSEQYVSKILSKMPFDYLEMSWKSFGGNPCQCKLNSQNDHLNNPSAWSRVIKRDFMGDLRFNENKDAAEDEDFCRKMNYSRSENRAVITDYMYFYRTSNENSLFNKYMRGLCNAKRIIYFYNVITPDMTYLIDEIKYEDQFNEVIVVTNNCCIPEIRKYAQVYMPSHFRCHELRGEQASFITVVKPPVKEHLVMFTHKTFDIGGIETFTYNFCMSLKDYYDITILYDVMDANQIARLAPHVKLIKNDLHNEIYCDILIVNRIIDSVPKNIIYKRSIQMVHTCRHIPSYHIPKDRDTVICVSEACKKSFGSEAGDNCIVLPNVIPEQPYKEALFLISATRLDTNEKGQRRMLKLASAFEKKGIPYVWLYFSNCKLDNAPANMICMKPTLDIRNYISRADYLVQLSDTESFCFSIAESLICHVPVICTDLEVLPEIGVKDGVNAHVLPMELNAEYDVEKIYNNRLRGFKYSYDNWKIIEEWKKILGNPEKKKVAENKPAGVKVQALITYTDLVLNSQVNEGSVLTMLPSRAHYLQDIKKFVKILD